MKDKLKKLYKTLGGPVICALLGFIGAACIVPSAGVLTALPILPLCGICAGLLFPKRGVKTAFFAVCGMLISAGYAAEVPNIIIYGVICGATVFLCDCGISIIKKEKVRFCAVFPLGAAVALQLVFGGNLVTYFNAVNVSDNYIENTYEDSENEIIGKLEYDFLTRTWQREIVSKSYAEAHGMLTVCDKVVFDGYAKKTEYLLMDEERAKVAGILRKAFPDGSFTVVSERINCYPNGATITYPDNTDRSEDMVFSVYLGALTDPEGFLKTCCEYRKALKNAGIDTDKIIFRGGGWGLYPMQEVYTDSPFCRAKVKYNCGNVFDRRQDNLDKHFIKDNFLYN